MKYMAAWPIENWQMCAPHATRACVCVCVCVRSNVECKHTTEFPLFITDNPVLTVIDKQIRTLLWQRVTMNYEYKWFANGEWGHITIANEKAKKKKTTLPFIDCHPITLTRPMNFYLFFILLLIPAWKFMTKRRVGELTKLDERRVKP